MSNAGTPPPVFTPEFMVDPYPEIARLRREEPVHYVEAMALWYVTRYEDVKRLLSDTDVATPDRRAWEFYDPAPEGTQTRWLADNNLLAWSTTTIAVSAGSP